VPFDVALDLIGIPVVLHDRSVLGVSPESEVHSLRIGREALRSALALSVFDFCNNQVFTLS